MLIDRLRELGTDSVDFGDLFNRGCFELFHTAEVLDEVAATGRSEAGDAVESGCSHAL